MYCIEQEGVITPLPDLIVENLSVSSSANLVTISARVRNIGYASAGESTTIFHIIPFGYANLIPTPAIPDGGNVFLSTNFTLSSGTYNVTALADVQLEVEESIEDNNFEILQFTIP